MATQTRITTQGIQRNKALDEFDDGAMQEIINFRFRDGAWRPIPGKEKKHNIPAGSWTKIWLHVAEGVRNYVGYNKVNGQLSIIDMATGESKLIKNYEAGANINVRFLKRFLIAVGDTTDVLLYKEGSYTSVTLSYPPYLNIYKTEEKTEATTLNKPGSTTAEGLLGYFRKKIYDFSQDGFITGSVSFRFAWKMFDGSFVKHTIPDVVISGILDYNIYRKGADGADPYQFTNIRGYKLGCKIGVGYDDISTDIVTSLCIFMSKPEERYVIDETTITNEVLAQYLPEHTNNRRLSEMSIAENDEFDNLADAKNWYLVKEINIEDLQNLTGEYTSEIDLKGYMQDYAVRQIMPVDSFSHHQLGGGIAFNYNDRLILGDTKTKFGEVVIGQVNRLTWRTFPVFGTRSGYIVAILKTENGEKKVFTPATFTIFTQSGKYIIVLAPFLAYGNNNFVVGYQDARATKIDIIIDNLAGGYNLFGSLKLTKSKYGNYSYYKKENFERIEIQTTSLNTPAYPVDTTNILEDQNRVQISELKNPLVFPAKNSYQVGQGRIIGFGANTEPISTGQYGEYPLIVFTSKGIWAMLQGQGDILFAAINPLNGEVAYNQDQIISVGHGVVYSTKRGIYFVSGMKVEPLSDVIEGAPLLSFTNNLHFKNFLNNAKLCNLLSSISVIRVIDYISESKFGFDKINNELIVSNDNYEYSYVFNFESMSWHKVSDSYSIFINDYPNLLALNQNGIFDLSVESELQSLHFAFVTQPQTLKSSNSYKKLERSVLKCNLNATIATYITFAIFASDDLSTWQFITGGQRTGNINNILTTRSHGSAKYYIFLVCGQVDQSLTAENTIQAIDVQYTTKLDKKLRK